MLTGRGKTDVKPRSFPCRLNLIDVCFNMLRRNSITDIYRMQKTPGTVYGAVNARAHSIPDASLMICKYRTLSRPGFWGSILLVYALLEILAGGEGYALGSGDFDSLAVLRIAAGAGGTLFNFESTEAGELNLFAGGEGSGDSCYSLGDSSFRILLLEAGSGGDGFDEIGFCDHGDTPFIDKYKL